MVNGAMELGDGVVLATGEFDTWYPVYETEATARLDAELDDRIKELALPHLAAQEEYLDWKYGPQDALTRLQWVRRVLRRIF